MKTRALVLSLLLVASVFGAIPAQAATPGKIVCSVSASDKLIDKGEKVTITWKSINSLVSFGPGNTKVASSGSMQVSPTTTTIYKFKFVGLGGNEKCGVRVRIAGETVAP